MNELIIKTTKPKQVIDITESLESQTFLKSFKQGLCNIFLAHTTASLTTADLDPGTDLDMLDALKNLIPKIEFRHPHDPSHTPDHILSSLIGTSISVPIRDGKFVLGTWQKIVLIEFDGPKERKIIVSIIET